MQRVLVGACLVAGLAWGAGCTGTTRGLESDKDGGASAGQDGSTGTVGDAGGVATGDGGGTVDGAVPQGDAAVGGDGGLAVDGGVARDGGGRMDGGGRRDGGGPQDAGACGPNQVRDGRGVCRTMCAQQGDCPPRHTCNQAVGLCLPDETPVCVPANCPPGYTCPDGGVGSGPQGCVAIAGYCAADGDCALTERCQDHLCISRAGDIVMTCAADSDCGLLMTCRFGVCTGCMLDIQCALVSEGARCVLGTCVTADLGPAGECIGKTCPEGERCNLATGLCEATCETSADCGDGGRICAPVLNQCVTDFGCTADGGCQPPLTCAGAGVGGLSTGICIGCSDAVPCGPGLTCIVGACFPDLAATDCTGVTCPNDELCDPQGGACYPSNGTCQDATDCRPGHTCNFIHLCAGCSVDSDCRPSQRCFVGTCLPFQ